VGEAAEDAEAVGVPSDIGETSAVADASGDGLGTVPTGARPHATSNKANAAATTPSFLIAQQEIWKSTSIVPGFDASVVAHVD
jgi:hypothetical protein